MDAIMTIESEPLELFVPGRLCLFGEHSDWAGAYRKHNHSIRPGRTIVVGTEQGLSARVRRLAQARLVLRSTRGDGTTEEQELPMEAMRLAEVAAAGGFWAYAAGVAYRFLIDFGVGGLEVDNYSTTLPLKKGLSSSAAFCVLVARAFNRTYGLQLTTRGEMQYAYEGERLTPSQCGKMDQAVAFGQVPVLMTYDGDLLHVEPAQLGGGPLHFVLVDLRASKDTVAILSGLQEAFPHPVGREQEAAVELLGPINERITGQAVEAMAAGDAQRLGELMVEAQQEFDARATPLCPAQLASPVLHKVLAHPPIQELVYGGKGVGSQGDGTAQLLARDADSQAEVCAILEKDLGVLCIPFTVPPTGQPQPVPSSAPAPAAAAIASPAKAPAAAASSKEEVYILKSQAPPPSEALPQRQQQRRRGSTPKEAAANGAKAGAVAEEEAGDAAVPAPSSSMAPAVPAGLSEAQGSLEQAQEGGGEMGHVLGSTRTRDSVASLQEQENEEGQKGPRPSSSTSSKGGPARTLKQVGRPVGEAGMVAGSGGSGGKQVAAKARGGVPARPQPALSQGGEGRTAGSAGAQDALTAVQKALRGLKH